MINPIFTNEIRRIIFEKDLLDTYHMFQTTAVDVDIRDRIYIDILTPDYFVYLYEKYGLINDFFKSQLVRNELSKIYADLLIEDIENIENYGMSLITNYEPVVYINSI